MQALKQRVQGDFKYEVFWDSITSRKSVFKREGSKKLISVMQKGDVLVSVSVDRLSRVQLDMMKLADMLEERGVDFIMINQPGIKNKIMLGIYSGMAEEELITLKRRIAEKFQAKRARCEVVGQFPYGYSLDQEKLISIRKGDEVVMRPGILIPNQDEQAQIDLMCKYFDEGHSYRRVAALLNQAGYRNREGRPWGRMSVYRILNRVGRTRPPGQPHAEAPVELIPVSV
jgi:site-specific DNA recombinase